MMWADEKMKDEFYEWLDDCPVQWVRGNVNMESITYTFMTPDEEVDE
tara:strand:+ start:1141 stop:1281 length:141 start_codon:yes stop_codon:yes gene_type:complete